MKTGKQLLEEINAPCCESPALWWLAQMGFAARLGDSRLYFDLYLGDNGKRTAPPVFQAEDVTGAHYFFGSHDHLDHIDRPYWKLWANNNPQAKFVVSRALCEKLSRALDIPPARFLPISDGETVRDRNLEITGVAAAHELLEWDEKGESLHMSYIVRGAGISLFHAGDACLYEGLWGKLRAAGKLDVMILPINGRDGERLRRNCVGNMTYQEATDLAGDLHPGLTIPGHYELFADNCIDVGLFCDYMSFKYPALRYWVGEYGDQIEIQP